MGDYKLKIGTNEYSSEIEGTEDWGQSIVRDFNDKILRVRGDYSFKGWQGLYNVLYANTALNGACTALTGKVYYRGDTAEAYSELWRGEMKPQDFEFDLIKKSADGQILDNSWSAQFNNSKDQKVNLRTTLSRNGVAIQECPYTGCSFFDPTDSVEANYLVDTRICFRIFEVLNFLVNYYSDDTVTFVSDYFDIGGQGEQYWITTGKELRLHDGTANPEVSFSEVFEELDKKFDLWIIIEGTLEAPQLRIEPRSYALDESIVLTVDNPEGIVLQTDLELLYTTISIGSDAVDYDASTYANYHNSTFYAWSEETYNTTGACQFENNELDLVSTWKIDTNSIEQALGVSAQNEAFDDDIFLIEINPDGVNYQAYKFTDAVTNASDAVYYIYNYNLINEQVLSRWFDSIPSFVQKALSKNYYVYADDLSISPWDTLTQFPLPFDNDTIPPGSDVDSIYVTPTSNPGFPDTWGRVTAPVSGFYNVETSVSIGYLGYTYDIELKVEVWENGTSRTSPTVIRSIMLENSTGNTTDISVSGSATIFASANEQIVIKADQVYGGGGTGGVSLNGGYMILNAIPILESSDEQDDPLIFTYNVSRFKLSVSDYNTLTANKEKQIRFTDTQTGRAWNVWPKELKYNYEKQIAEGLFIGRSPLNEAVDICWVLDGESGLGIWDDTCYWIDGFGWIDSGSLIVLNPFFTGNPVGSWTLIAPTSQTGVGTFVDSGGGPLWQVGFTQTITLAAGSYTLYYDMSIDSGPNWNCAISLTNSDLPANLFLNSTNSREVGSIAFTVTGASSRTLTVQPDTLVGASTFTMAQILII